MYFLSSCFLIAITVSFSQLMYTFAEEIEVARPELVFSNPSSTSITLTVTSSNNSAIGEFDYEMKKMLS